MAHNSYGYKPPEEPCWHVMLIQEKKPPTTGGMSRLLLISKATGQVVEEYEITGK